MPSERSPFWSPVEPISPPPKPASRQRVWVEAPGTAPGSERLIPMPIYRHSRPCGRQPTYRGWEAGREEARRIKAHAPARCWVSKSRGTISKFFGTKSKLGGTNSKCGGTKSKFKILQFTSPNLAFSMTYGYLAAFLHFYFLSRFRLWGAAGT
jgi:hypothetical protein